MKKIFTSFLLALLVLLGAGSAAAKTVTFDIDNNWNTIFPTMTGRSTNSSGAGDIKSTLESVENDGIKLSVSPKSTSSTENRLWEGKGVLRLYSGTLTIKSSKENIKKVTFEFNKKLDLTTTVGTFEKPIWTGDAAEIVFTQTVDKGISSQISKITVEYGEATTDPDPEDPTVTYTEVANIAAFKAVAKDTPVKFTNPVTAVYQNGINLYIKDDTGYLLVYGNTNQTYTPGQVIPAGFYGTAGFYNGQPQLVIARDAESGFAAGTAGTLVPEVIQTSDVVAANYGHLVSIKGVTIGDVNKSSFNLTDNAGTAPGYNTFKITLPTELTAKYDVLAIVGSFLSSSAAPGTEPTYQVLPIEFTAAGGTTQPTVTEVATIADMNALAKDTQVKYTGNATVVYQNGRYLYITDGTTNALVYGDLTVKYNKGDKISGFQGIVDEYYGVKQLKPTAETFVAGTAGDAINPTELTLEEISTDMVHQYVLVKGVTLSEVSGGNFKMADQTKADFAGFNKFNGQYYDPSIELPTDLTKSYTVEGFIALFKGAPQIMPTMFTLTSSVDGVSTTKAVAGVKYYNVAGVESTRAHEGVNIVVTTYTDGTQTVSKVVK